MVAHIGQLKDCLRDANCACRPARITLSLDTGGVIREVWAHSGYKAPPEGWTLAVADESE